MSLADLAAIGSFVSGLAVLISLVFLYFQVRQMNFQAQQNARHTRALVFQGGAARASDQFLRMAEADLVAASIVGNGGVPTPEAIKRVQFEHMWRSHYISWDDNFSQHEAGLISDDLFGRLRSVMIEQLRGNPGYARLYADIVHQHSPDSGFHKFIDGALAEAARQA
jgi:hypothetical protein